MIQSSPPFLPPPAEGGFLISTQPLTAMLTHRRKTANLNEGHVILFCDNDKNWSYGDHVWELRSALPAVTAEVIAFAADYYGISEAEADGLCNPVDIVDSAGAWDDAQFVSDLYQALEPVGFRTPDGAVVLDRHSVDIVKVA